MFTGLEIPFERITYRDGQQLTARDLQDDQQRDARLRWLHTRYLHQTWGIALGLEVRRVEGDDTVVAVGPGYAVDEVGRDIVLAEGLHISVPEVAGSFVLTLSYQPDSAFRDRQGAAIICISGGLDSRRERPVFTWQRPEAVHFGPEVPLVQVVVDEAGAIQGEELDLRARRNAQPFVRPHMGWGITEPGQTGWDSWEEEGSLGGRTARTLGLEVTVDTTEAGFIKTPYYFAVLQSDASPEPWSGDSGSTFFLGNAGFITNPTKESFTYRLLKTDYPPFETVSVNEAEQQQWHITWLGLEPVTGCEPPLIFLYTLAGLPIDWLQFFGTSGGSR